MSDDSHPPLRPDLRKYLEYVRNTGGNVDVTGFDDDWEPIGPKVRAELVPAYVRVRDDGNLELTARGLVELAR